jgi:hypothetical protein
MRMHGSPSSQPARARQSPASRHRGCWWLVTAAGVAAWLGALPTTACETPAPATAASLVPSPAPACLACSW